MILRAIAQVLCRSLELLFGFGVLRVAIYLCDLY